MTLSDRQADERLDACLRSAGASLPEPTASPEVRAAITALTETGAAGGRALDRSRRVTRLRATACALGGIAAVVTIVAGVLLVENARLRERLDGSLAALRSATATVAARQRGVVTLAGDAHAELLAVNVHHDGCSYATTTTPKFRELIERYGDRRVLFVTLDVTGLDDEQALAFASRFGLTQLLENPPYGHATGVVSLVSAEDKTIIAAAEGTGDIEKIEKRLTGCEKSCPPR